MPPLRRYLVGGVRIESGSAHARRRGVTGGPSEPRPYRRRDQRVHIDRASLDWVLLGDVGKIQARSADMMTLMVRAEPTKAILLADAIELMIQRAAAIVEAGTAAQKAIKAALREIAAELPPERTLQHRLGEITERREI